MRPGDGFSGCAVSRRSPSDAAVLDGRGLGQRGIRSGRNSIKTVCLAQGWRGLSRWPREQRLVRRDLHELGGGRLHPHERGVGPVHATQVELRVALPRLQTGVTPSPVEEDPQTTVPGERVAHPRGGETILCHHDQLAILFQESDRYPAALARATPDRLDDDRVTSRVGRTWETQAERPNAQRASNRIRRSLKPCLLETRHGSQANFSRASRSATCAESVGAANSQQRVPLPRAVKAFKAGVYGVGPGHIRLPI